MRSILNTTITLLSTLACLGIVRIVKGQTPITPSLPGAKPTMSFHRDILPILQTACAGCHGGSDPSGALTLTSFMTLKKGGKGGQELAPGKSSDSRIVKYLLGTLQPKMPPGGGLRQTDIDRIRQWIDAGAVDDAALPSVGSKSGSVTHKTASAAASGGITAVGGRMLSSMPMSSAPTPVTALTFSPDSKMLVAGLYRQVQFWDVGTFSLIRSWKGFTDAVHSLTYTRDGKWLAAAGGASGDRGEIRIWDVEHARELVVLGEHSDAVNAVAFSPDGARLASASSDKSVKVWDVAKGVCLATMKEHSDAVTSIAWSPDGKFIVSGSADWSVKVWDSATYRRVYSLGAHGSSVTDCEFSRDGKWLITSGNDNLVKVWNFGAESSVLAQQLSGHSSPVLAATFEPNQRFFATASADHTVKIWRTGNWSVAFPLTDLKDWVYAVRFSPDNNHLAAGAWDGTIVLWSLPDAKFEARLTTFPAPLTKSLSPGGAADHPNTTLTRKQNSTIPTTSVPKTPVQ